MKKTKVIIPALGILLLSTAASVTGTVAWFTTNNTVAADGMQIMAKVSGNLYIEEGTISQANIDQIDETSVTLTSDESDLVVSPVDIISAEGGAAARKPTAYSEIPTVDDAGAGSSWETIGSITPSNTASAVESYVASNLVSIANRSTDELGFKLHPVCTITLNGKQKNLGLALRAGIVIGQSGESSTIAYYESEPASGDVNEVVCDFLTYPGSAAHGTVAAVPTLLDNKAYNLNLLVWFEGEDENCYVSNAVNLSEYDIAWTFSSAA